MTSLPAALSCLSAQLPPPTTCAAWWALHAGLCARQCASWHSRLREKAGTREGSCWVCWQETLRPTGGRQAELVDQHAAAAAGLSRVYSRGWASAGNHKRSPAACLQYRACLQAVHSLSPRLHRSHLSHLTSAVSCRYLSASCPSLCCSSPRRLTSKAACSGSRSGGQSTGAAVSERHLPGPGRDCAAQGSAGAAGRRKVVDCSSSSSGGSGGGACEGAPPSPHRHRHALCRCLVQRRFETVCSGVVY